MVAAVLDAVPLAIAAGSKLAVLVDRCSAAGPVHIADVDLVLSAAAAQPFVGPVPAATGQHVGVIDQHSLVQFDSCLTLQRLSLPFWWQEVTRGVPTAFRWILLGLAACMSTSICVRVTATINTTTIIGIGIVIASICIRIAASSTGRT